MTALLLFTSLLAASPLHQELRDFVTEPEALALEADLAKATTALSTRASQIERCEPKDVGSLLARLVGENLAQKHAMHFPLDAARIRRQVIAAEAFKVETFVATGVFPKRYFGYLDEQWDTAAPERRLKVAARKAAHACNRWLENAKAPFRVTEQELVVTFLAEGGAILLREKQGALDSIHPVKDIGLDDIAKGFVDLGRW